MAHQFNALIRRAALLAAGATLATLAWADGGGGGPETGRSGAVDLSREFAAAQAAIDKQDWSTAISELEQARRKDAKNADVYNLLGYSLRKNGRLDEALDRYQSALRLDPQHKGAHEYIGEAYLLKRQPDKAREHLAKLKGLCGESCEEYQDLARALESYQAAAK
jgi:Flp pilus assembly protein TadD